MDELYSLGFLLNRASVSLAKSMNASLIDNNIDLPHSQFIVLRCLYYKDGLSQLEIANLLSKDAAAIKRTVDLLEKKGLVVRNRIRALKNAVCISDKGRQLIPEAMKLGESLSDEALNGIDEQEQELLRVMLDKIYTNLDKR